MNDVKTIYDAINKRRCCSNSGSSSDNGSGGLVVNGTQVESDDGNSYNFIPNAGEPSFDDAVDAFRSGRPVFARCIMSFNGTAVQESIVLFDSCDINFTDDSSTSISHLIVNNSYLFWDKSSSGQNTDSDDDNNDQDDDMHK